MKKEAEEASLEKGKKPWQSPFASRQAGAFAKPGSKAKATREGAATTVQCAHRQKVATTSNKAKAL